MYLAGENRSTGNAAYLKIISFTKNFALNFPSSKMDSD